jgi:NAD(P)-dependent dehydrogenase (short-subunit alcohol dehydrogenase family)
VIGTTRFPERSSALFADYADSSEWSERLIIYDQPLDSSERDMKPALDAFTEFVQGRFESVTNLLFCAGRVVSRAADLGPKEVLKNGASVNRYGDRAFANSEWAFTLDEVRQEELEVGMRINAIGPTLAFQTFLPLMKKSRTIPYFVNLHAHEGLLTVPHGDLHIQACMAKLARHMLTRCLPLERLLTENGVAFAIHGVDPGLFSVDEYGEDGREWTIPPLDEVDGAARVLYPIFTKMESTKKTRKNFTDTLY